MVLTFDLKKKKQHHKLQPEWMTIVNNKNNVMMCHGCSQSKQTTEPSVMLLSKATFTLHVHFRRHAIAATRRNYRGCSRCGCTGARGVSGPRAQRFTCVARRVPPFQVHQQTSLDEPNLSIASHFLGYAYVQIRAIHNKAVV